MYWPRPSGRIEKALDMQSVEEGVNHNHSYGRPLGQDVFIWPCSKSVILNFVCFWLILHQQTLLENINQKVQ